MFDYQAGEKYKLTLIMVALAGLLGGAFFTVLLMPAPEATPRGRRQMQKWQSNPDATGGMPINVGVPGSQQGGPGPSGPGQGGPGGPGGPQDMQAQAAGPMRTDPVEARNLLETKFLPLAWDLSAYSARASQGQALQFMTDECKRAYQSNIWTPEVAKQIEESGVQSRFTPRRIEPGQMRQDGSVEVTVEGEQELSVPGKGGRKRPVKVVYLVKQYPDGMRIAGISEAGPTQ